MYHGPVIVNRFPTQNRHQKVFTEKGFIFVQGAGTEFAKKL